jgi:hypothetical protein
MHALKTLSIHVATHVRRCLSCLCTAALLAGCGGGGDDGEAAGATPVPLAAAPAATAQAAPQRGDAERIVAGAATTQEAIDYAVAYRIATAALHDASR